jgi:hypothetical protein
MALLAYIRWIQTEKTSDLFHEGCEQPHSLYKFLILEFLSLTGCTGQRA